MDKAVLEGLLSALEAGGLRAYREYPDKELLCGQEVFAVAGAESLKSLSPGLGEYLGLNRPGEGLSEKEVYGKRLELSLYLEVYSPFSGGRGTEGISDYIGAIGRCIDELGSGIRVMETEFGEVFADEELCAFRQRCRLNCQAFLIAESSGEEGEFLDFVLKGRI